MKSLSLDLYVLSQLFCVISSMWNKQYSLIVLRGGGGSTRLQHVEQAVFPHPAGGSTHLQHVEQAVFPHPAGGSTHLQHVKQAVLPDPAGGTSHLQHVKQAVLPDPAEGTTHLQHVKQAVLPDPTGGSTHLQHVKQAILPDPTGGSTHLQHVKQAILPDPAGGSTHLQHVEQAVLPDPTGGSTHLQHVEQAVLAGDEQLVLLDDLVYLVEVDGLPPDVCQELTEVSGAFRDPVPDPVDDQRQSLVLRQHIRFARYQLLQFAVVEFQHFLVLHYVPDVAQNERFHGVY